MIKNYFKIALRNIAGQKLFTFINVLGLSVGMATALLIMVWVNFERSFDQFHSKKDQIFRVVQSIQFEEEVTWAITHGPLAPSLVANFPEIQRASRFVGGTWNVTIEKESHQFRNGYVDPSFLKMFDFEWIKGDRAHALSTPKSVVLTEKIATEIFGEQDPLGATLNLFDFIDVVVVGVIQDIPIHSHLQFEALSSMDIAKEMGYTVESWGNSTFNTYIQLDALADYKEVESKIAGFARDKPTLEEEQTLKLQPLSSIHFSSGIDFENAVVGNKTYVIIFFSAGLFLLVIASINFMNLAMLLSLRRSKEVGIRKSVGAAKNQLVMQFLLEAVLMVTLAFGLGALLAKLMLPLFQEFVRQPLVLDFSDPQLIGTAAVLLLITVLLSGAYPAFYLTSFDPIKVLKGQVVGYKGGQSQRNIFVVVQFVMSIMLLTGTIAVYIQVDYLKNKNLGYNHENIVYFPMAEMSLSKAEGLRHEVMQLDNVLEASTSASVPWYGYQFSNALWSWPGKDPSVDVLFRIDYAGYNYHRTFNIDVIAGRSFEPDFNDSLSVLINETAAKAMQLKDPVGAVITYDGARNYKVVGVIKDFHFRSLHVPIDPLIVGLAQQENYFMWVKYNPNEQSHVVSSLKTAFNNYFPEAQFNHYFLDASMARIYASEERVELLLLVFSVLAMVVLSLGLFGLIGFSMNQRLKEIAIRKALGASRATIVLMLFKNFLFLILLAVCIGIPIANFFIRSWREGFPYMPPFNWLTFIIPPFIVLVLAVLVVLTQSVGLKNKAIFEQLKCDG